MKPPYSILDRNFRYVPAVATSVAETWRRFGWRPMKETRRTRAHAAGEQRNDAPPDVFDDFVCV